MRSEADCLNQLSSGDTSSASTGGESPPFVKLHDADHTPDNSLVLIMETIKGRPLLDHILFHSEPKQQQAQQQQQQEKPTGLFDERLVAKYVRQLLDALGKLHARNIVHLNVNPDNLLIDAPTRSLKLVGFTHAKCLDESAARFHADIADHDYGQPE